MKTAIRSQHAPEPVAVEPAVAIETAPPVPLAEQFEAIRLRLNADIHARKLAHLTQIDVQRAEGQRLHAAAAAQMDMPKAGRLADLANAARAEVLRLQRDLSKFDDEAADVSAGRHRELVNLQSKMLADALTDRRAELAAVRAEFVEKISGLRGLAGRLCVLEQSFGQRAHEAALVISRGAV
jgi:hypothetical protein